MVSLYSSPFNIHSNDLDIGLSYMAGISSTYFPVTLSGWPILVNIGPTYDLME